MHFEIIYVNLRMYICMVTSIFQIFISWEISQSSEIKGEDDEL